MSKLKKQLLLFSIVGLLCSCSSKELTKTIVLPEQKPDQLDSAIINLQNIKEYSYEVDVEAGEIGKIALDVQGNLCLVRKIEEQYEYQKINLDTKEVIYSLPMKESIISQIILSPNGRYVAYEKFEQNQIQLHLFSIEKGTTELLGEWEEGTKLFNYQWSSDGTVLFAWPDYVSEVYDDWWIYRYEVGIEHETVLKTKVKVGGNGCFRRYLSSNENGSQIFVRTVYENEYRNTPDMESYAVTGKQKQINENENNEQRKENEIERGSINFILDFESDNRIQLRDLPNDIDYPFQYTKEGLFIQDQSEKLCLITNLLEEPQKLEILDVRDTSTFICKNGDHIFLIEQQSYSKLQLAGIRMQHGTPNQQQVLYKDIPGDCANMFIVNDDKTILLQSYTILDDKYLVTVTSLEY